MELLGIILFCVALYFFIAVPQRHEAQKQADLARRRGDRAREADYRLIENWTFVGLIILVILLALIAPFVSPPPQ